MHSLLPASLWVSAILAKVSPSLENDSRMTSTSSPKAFPGPPQSLSSFHLQTLCLRQNLIKCIENLEELHSLRELDLYDNQIKKIENLDALTELE